MYHTVQRCCRNKLWRYTSISVGHLSIDDGVLVHVKWGTWANRQQIVEKWLWLEGQDIYVAWFLKYIMHILFHVLLHRLIFRYQKIISAEQTANQLEKNNQFSTVRRKP